MKTKRQNKFKDESGMATLEMVPLILVFLVTAAYTFGMFGVTHSAVLNSIAARNYAFETFRNRADLTYFRSNAPIHMWYSQVGARIHAITSEVNPTQDATGGQFPATERRIAMGLDSGSVERELASADESRGNQRLHNQDIFEIQASRQNDQFGVNPVWLMTQYGICLNAQCGDN